MPLTNPAPSPAAPAPAANLPASVMTPLVLFSIGAFVGFLVTAIPTMTPESWHTFAGIRIAVQLGSALWLGLALASFLRKRSSAPRAPAIALAIFTVLGVALSFNALLDFALGPQVVEGQVVSEVEMRSNRRNKLEMNLEIQHPDHSIEKLTLAGSQANVWQERAAQCDLRRPLRLTTLAHLDALLEVGCTPGQGEGLQKR